MIKCLLYNCDICFPLCSFIFKFSCKVLILYNCAVLWRMNKFIALVFSVVSVMVHQPNMYMRVKCIDSHGSYRLCLKQ
jgi:hypothetical protein